MTTTIHSNGSKWHGEPLDTLPDLFRVLQRETLHPMFEPYGNFIISHEPPLSDGTVRFWGNFATVSHVFQIDTDEPLTIAALTLAIRANQATDGYRRMGGARQPFLPRASQGGAP